MPSLIDRLLSARVVEQESMPPEDYLLSTSCPVGLFLAWAIWRGLLTSEERAAASTIEAARRRLRTLRSQGNQLLEEVGL